MEIFLSVSPVFHPGMKLFLYFAELSLLTPGLCFKKGACVPLCHHSEKNNEETFLSPSPQWGSCVMPLQQSHEHQLLRLQGFESKRKKEQCSVGPCETQL